MFFFAIREDNFGSTVQTLVSKIRGPTVFLQHKLILVSDWRMRSRVWNSLVLVGSLGLVVGLQRSGARPSSRMPPKAVASTSRTDGGRNSSPKKAGKVATAKGYRRPDKLPGGFEIEDKSSKRTWKIGEMIGQGGFADVYSVTDLASKASSAAAAKYVLKLEPKDNAPLFQESHFFKAAAKKDLIADFERKHGLKHLGVPEFVASGVMEYNDKSFRWLVMPRLGRNVHQILEDGEGKFSRQTVIMLACQLIDILEYIHTQGYAHADIKAGNLMTGATKADADQIYLIDYGLVKKFISEGQHIQYVENPKAAHDGTLELTSIDAHKGAAPTRRGDLQILGFNLIKWLIGALPWSDSTDANFVRSQKITYLQNITEFFRVAFPPNEQPPREVVDYFKEIKDLKYDDKPNYVKLREIFTKASKDLKVRKSDLFGPSTANAEVAPASPKKAPRGRKAGPSTSDDQAETSKPVPKKRSTATTTSKTSLGALNGHSKDDVKATTSSTTGLTKARSSRAPSSDTAAASRASSTGSADGVRATNSEVAAVMATLPVNQQRIIKAALQDAKNGDQLSEEVLSKLPAGSRRKINAAVAADNYPNRQISEDSEMTNDDDEVPAITAKDSKGSTKDAATSRSTRPTRAAAKGVNYREEVVSPAHVPTKRVKKSEL